jgi:predicted nucleotidyltransferase
MSPEAQIKRILKELKPYLQNHFNVNNIGYFGSYAKGTATEDSDIDLLVDFSEPPGMGISAAEVFFRRTFRQPD